MKSTFGLTVMSHAGKSTSRWSTTEIEIPARSEVIIVDGSGKSSIKHSLSLWQLSSAAGTSRAVFSALVESIVQGQDPNSGGAPQLGSLYRIGNGRLIGIIHNNQRYFAGAKLLGPERNLPLEWRNDLFEIADGQRKIRKSKAQPHQPR